MSVRLDNINLSTLTGPLTQDTKNVQLAQCGWIEYLNESPYTVELQLGGLNIPIPAWYDYPVQLQSQVAGYWSPSGSVAFPPVVTPVLLIPASLSSQSTQLLTTLYLTGETPPVTVPTPLVRQAYIPNNVSTNTMVASSTLNNTGNAPATNIVAVSSTGATGNTWTVTNDGLWNIAVTIANALVTVLQSFEPGALGGNVLQIGAANYQIEVLGNLKVDGTTFIGPMQIFGNLQMQAGTTTSLDNGLITTDSAGNFNKVGTLNGVYVDDNAGISLARIGSSAANAGDVLDAIPNGDLFAKAANGAFKFQSPNGTTRWSLTAMNTGTVTTSGTATVNHGLGGIPAAVLVTPATAGSTATFSASNYTSTQFTLLNGSGVSQTFRWFAYR